MQNRVQNQLEKRLSNQMVNQPRELVLYSDVDGTLVNSSGEVSHNTIQEIEQFVADGHGFTLATGRSFRAVQRLIKRLPINTPLVLCNGAYVYDLATGRAQWSSISEPVVRDVLPLLERIDGARVYMERCDTSLWVTDESVLQEPYVVEENLQPRVIRSMEEVFSDGDVLKMGIKFTHSTLFTKFQLQELISYLSFELDSEVSWCFSSKDYLEIMPVNISKWSGILASQTMRGYRDGYILAVGDHHNDVEMILHADCGVAMGNGVAAVKEVAKLHIGCVDEEAVGQLLKQLRLGSPPARPPQIGLFQNH